MAARSFGAAYSTVAPTSDPLMVRREIPGAIPEIARSGIYVKPEKLVISAMLLAESGNPNVPSFQLGRRGRASLAESYNPCVIYFSLGSSRCSLGCRGRQFEGVHDGC